MLRSRQIFGQLKNSQRSYDWAGLATRFDDPAMTREVNRYRAFYELATAEAKIQAAAPLEAVDFSKYKSQVSSESALAKIAELEAKYAAEADVTHFNTWEEVDAAAGRELYSNSDRAAEEAEFEKFTEGFKADYERVSAQLEWLKEHRADEFTTYGELMTNNRDAAEKMLRDIEIESEWEPADSALSVDETRQYGWGERLDAEAALKQ